MKILYQIKTKLKTVLPVTIKTYKREIDILRKEQIEVSKANRLRIIAKIAFTNPSSLPVIKEFREQKLIVSLTTFPARDFEVDIVVYSLLMQSTVPDKIIIWLSEEEYPNLEKDIPPYLYKLKQFGVDFLFCKNIKSYKKLIPALTKFPNDIIVTADDDVFYHANWLKLLYNAYLKEPEYIHAHRVRRIALTKDKKAIGPYTKWKNELDYTEAEASYLNLFTGVGGVLYPPKSLHKDVENEALFLQLCPNADDIWFWVQAVLLGTKINVVKNNIAKPVDLGIDNDYTKLWVMNYNENDTQIDNVLRHYPQLMSILTNQ